MYDKLQQRPEGGCLATGRQWQQLGRAFSLPNYDFSHTLTQSRHKHQNHMRSEHVQLYTRRSRTLEERTDSTRHQAGLSTRRAGCALTCFRFLSLWIRPPDSQRPGTLAAGAGKAPEVWCCGEPSHRLSVWESCLSVVVSASQT